MVENVIFDSDRYLFHMYWDVEKYANEPKFVFADELTGYTFIPYTDKLKDIPECKENRDAFEDVRIYLLVTDKKLIKKVPCNMVEEQKRIYMTDGNFNKYWKFISERLCAGEQRISEECVLQESMNCKVDFTYVENPYRKAEIGPEYTITYKGRTPDIEVQRLVSKRASAMDDNKYRYIYSKSDKTVHDKSCHLVEKIQYWDFEALETFPEEEKLCSCCKGRMYVRVAIQNDNSHFHWYWRFFERGKVPTYVLKRFFFYKGAELSMPAANIFRIRYKEDSWLLSTDKQGKYMLRHNNYSIVDGERIMGTGFHLQKHYPTSLTGIICYIEDYDWRVHLEPPMNTEQVEETTDIAESAEEIVLSEQKLTIFGRIKQWMLKALFLLWNQQ